MIMFSVGSMSDLGSKGWKCIDLDLFAWFMNRNESFMWIKVVGGKEW